MNNIAGFWRRFFAFTIDCFILGIAGFILGLFFSNFFIALGGWGHLVGFTIALVYFGILDSSFSQGRTIGKRLMKIRVAKATGQPLSVGASCLRFTVLGIPFFLNNSPVLKAAFLSTANIIVSVLLFGIWLSLGYLFLFNRQTKQSLHDLLTGAYVLKSPVEGVNNMNIWKGHYVVVAALLIVSAFVPTLTGLVITKSDVSELRSLQQSLQAESGVNDAAITVGRSFITGPLKSQETTHSLSSRIVLARKPDDYDRLSSRLAKIILQEYPLASEKNSISVKLSYGYDIGIASSWENRNYSFSPQEWQQRIAALPDPSP